MWLNELSGTHNRVVTLATVPKQKWDAFAARRFDAIGFMGAWERAPQGAAGTR